MCAEKNRLDFQQQKKELAVSRMAESSQCNGALQLLMYSVKGGLTWLPMGYKGMYTVLASWFI